ncbi:IS6 family transposase, partial [Sinorhizobium meliloti]
MSRCLRLNDCGITGWDEQSDRKLQEPPLSTA